MEDREKSCGAILIDRQDDQIRTLIVRQNAGHWGFPKGHGEGDESEFETAFREVREETGYKIRRYGEFRDETHYSPRPGVMKDVVYFMAEVTGGKQKRQKEEISEICWVSLLDAVAVLTFDNDAMLLRKAIRYQHPGFHAGQSGSDCRPFAVACFFARSARTGILVLRRSA